MRTYSRSALLNLLITPFYFSCDINCNQPANPSARISLSTTCTGLACSTAEYQWQLFTVDSSDVELSEIILTRDMTQSELNLSGIIIKANQLAGGLSYRLKVTASPDYGPPGNAAYQFRMNAPPHSGQCTVTPGTGDALKTNFAFNCSGWQVKSFSNVSRHLFIQYVFVFYCTKNGNMTVPASLCT